MGTRISYRGGKPNPKKDNRDFFKSGEYSEDSAKDYSEEEFLENMKNPDMCFMNITDDNVFAICKLWYKNFPFLLLEPNPVTFYYSLAYDVCKQVDDSQKQFSDILSSTVDLKINRAKMAVAYSYVFKVNSVGIIFSFLALEAFLNQQLPQHNEEITYKGKQVTKEKIERYFSFVEKLDVVIPQLTGRDFTKSHPRKREVIQHLIDLRHEMTHLKQKKGSGFTRYELLYQKVLDADIKKIVRTVKTLINFYYPKLIVNYKFTPSPVRKVTQ